ncbi:MAG: bleomycin resistance protein [Phenylobacterium sp.]|jgi:catechol 2,3-dioxygenase-like lactoylglutathione lyase family enzyme|uniref:VOC family protein n=1 Tax=Phenylobacterium sp. TaxID=1871053 RepID=UPI002636C3F4|nr:VOC family protein [Phenylobacterium sp.]MDB5437157.1 bleomycin resistance protein [Phenylobacterium sp.]MDB5462743.1 bleomycin resistance protein [Phenylobacterium sp.]MDB5498758.1 bleomycin resistance protein [Phenylobacterium sp.]
MSIELNHTIVHTSDREASANFLSEILGLAEPRSFGPFLAVETANGVSLDFMADPGPIAHQHYAFLVSEADFDAIFERVSARGMTYWADPAQRRENVINTRDGGRGFYFLDPSGHFLEVLTRPYGSGAA